MPVFNNTLAGAAGSGGAADYNIERSLRFNSADSAYLNRTPSSAGNRKTWTWSGWVKRSSVDTSDQGIIAATGGGALLRFKTNQIDFVVNGLTHRRTSQVFRDPSSWYHFVWAVDTTQATASDRSRFYVNGVEVTEWATDNAIAQDTDTGMNNAVAHVIGATDVVPNDKLDAYLADFHLVEGQALAPTDFGEFDATTGVWNPIRFTGSYGQGFTTSQATGALPIYNTTGDYGAVKGSGTRTDSSSSNIELAVAMDGTNGGTTFTDEHATIKGSGSAVALTAVGNVQTVTSQNKFYGSSASFDGNGDYLSFTNIDLQRSNFTYEAWVYATDTTKLLPTVIFTAGFSSGVIHSFGLANSSGAINAVFGANTRPSSGNYYFQAPAITANKWNHIAWVRNGTTISIYVNGVIQTLDTTNGGNGGRDEVTNVSTIGTNDANEDFSGYIQDARVYSSAKYTADFTVPGISNSFHLDFSDNSSNSALGTDSSGNNNDWTVNNLSVVNANGNYVPDLAATYDGPLLAFDGNTSTRTRAATSGQPLVFTPTGGIAYTSSIEVWDWLPSGSTYWTVNGGTAVYSPNSGNQWVTVATGSGTLTNLSSYTYGRGGFAAIRIDGTILVDYRVDKDDDSLIDSPTNYDASSGNNGGNYCTMNPLRAGVATNPHILSNGNLDIDHPTTDAWSSAYGTLAASSGKWYWEQTWTEGLVSIICGIGNELAQVNNYPADTHSLGYYFGDGSIYTGISGLAGAHGAAIAIGDVLGVALDVDAGTVDFYKNGVKQGSTITHNITGHVGPLVSTYSGKLTMNFGQRPFAYTPPTGFKSLCTQNLDDPPIADPSTAMDVVLYDGNGSTSRDITGLGFASAPDLVWIKNRSTTSDHVLTDSVRGATKELRTNLNSAEVTRTNGLIAFNSDGFEIGNNGSYNSNGQSYVAWAWDAGTSNTSISAGGLNSSVYNQGQDYYATGTQSGSWAGSYDWEGVFISQDTTSLTPAESLATGGTTKFVFGTSISASTSVTIIARRQQTGTFKINAGETDETSVSVGTTSGVEEATITFNGSVKNIQIESTGNYIYVSGIKIDGRLLVKPTATVDNVPAINSVVRANASAGFSISTHSRTTAASISTWGHGLNAAPEFAILKPYNGSYSWYVWHKSMGNNKRILLNGDGGPTTYSFDVWSSDSTTLGVYGTIIAGGGTALDCVTYAWAPVTNYSAFGSYTGNGNTDGPFVALSFRPAFLLLKRTDTTGQWLIYDNKREGYNFNNDPLYANLSHAEGTTDYIDLLSNGFKVRNTHGNINGSGGTYIYAAFAENPFKIGRAR